MDYKRIRNTIKIDYYRGTIGRLSQKVNSAEGRAGAEVKQLKLAIILKRAQGFFKMCAEKMQYII
ncbi:MAG: hypothetical protein LT067_01080 [Sulfurovum sp.]|jgi:hypothetical protein|nr:hypothetical protein [Sulfurovum sp.]